MQATAKFWDGIAEKYARTPIKDIPSYEQTLSRTANYLNQTNRVLEIGCGTGSTALKLSEHVAEIDATDISSGMLEVGKRKAVEQKVTNVRFIEADAAQPPREDYDAVLGFNILHLVDDLDDCLMQVHRALKPGGIFVSKTFVTQESGGSLKYRVIRLALPLMQLLGRAPFVRFLSGSELDRAMERAGFDLVEGDSFPAKDARRFIVARKR